VATSSTLEEKIVRSVCLVERKEFSIAHARVHNKRRGDPYDRKSAAHDALTPFIRQRHEIKNSTLNQCGYVLLHVHAAWLCKMPRAKGCFDGRIHDLLHFRDLPPMLGERVGVEKSEDRLQKP
jgi:hypothetical protein